MTAADDQGCSIRSLSHPLSRVTSRGGATSPLAVAGCIACTDARLCEAFSCPWPFSLTFYTLRDIARPAEEPLACAQVQEASRASKPQRLLSVPRAARIARAAVASMPGRLRRCSMWGVVTLPRLATQHARCGAAHPALRSAQRAHEPHDLPGLLLREDGGDKRRHRGPGAAMLQNPQEFAVVARGLPRRLGEIGGQRAFDEGGIHIGHPPAVPPMTGHTESFAIIQPPSLLHDLRGVRQRILPGPGRRQSLRGHPWTEEVRGRLKRERGRQEPPRCGEEKSAEISHTRSLRCRRGEPRRVRRTWAARAARTRRSTGGSPTSGPVYDPPPSGTSLLQWVSSRPWATDGTKSRPFWPPLPPAPALGPVGHPSPAPARMRLPLFGHGSFYSIAPA